MACFYELNAFHLFNFSNFLNFKIVAKLAHRGEKLQQEALSVNTAAKILQMNNIFFCECFS